MDYFDINKFLDSLGVSYSTEGREHYQHICSLIAYKMMNPNYPESNFVTLVAEEKWDQAYHFADTRNKEAFGISLFQKFVEYIKSRPEYITKNREDKLKQLDI
jgi:hypothetical protein